jgi:hypothetical protein
MNLDIAIYEAAHSYPGGLGALAKAMEMKYDSLKHKVLPTYPTKHLSPTELTMLIRLCGPEPLHAFCAGLDHTAQPLPRMDIPVGAEIARAMREAGGFLATATAAVEDNKVDGKEMIKAETAALNALVAIASAVAGLRAMHARAKVRPDLRAA